MAEGPSRWTTHGDAEGAGAGGWESQGGRRRREALPWAQEPG